MRRQHFPELNLHSLLKKKSQKLYNQTQYKFLINKELQPFQVRWICLVYENKLLYSFLQSQKQIFQIINPAGNISDSISIQGTCKKLFMPTNDVIFLQITNIEQHKLKIIKWDLKHKLILCIFQIHTTDQYEMIYFAQTRLICLCSVSEKTKLDLIYFQYSIQFGSCIHIFQASESDKQPQEVISIKKINERSIIGLFLQSQYQQQFKFYILNLLQNMNLEKKTICLNLMEIISKTQIWQIEPLIFYVRFQRDQYPLQDDRVSFAFIWNQNQKSYRTPNFHIGGCYYNLQFTTQFSEPQNSQTRKCSNNPTYFVDMFSEKIIDKFVPKKKDKNNEQICVKSVYPAYNNRLLLQLQIFHNFIMVYAVQLKFGYYDKLLLAFLMQNLFQKWDYTLIQNVCQLYHP